MRRQKIDIPQRDIAFCIAFMRCSNRSILAEKQAPATGIVGEALASMAIQGDGCLSTVRDAAAKPSNAASTHSRISMSVDVFGRTLVKTCWHRPKRVNSCVYNTSPSLLVVYNQVEYGAGLSFFAVDLRVASP